MPEQRIAVLVGDSLLMDTIEASLQNVDNLGLMRIHSTVKDVEEQLSSVSPDLVIFDVTASSYQFVMPFMRNRPGVPLLGLDVTCSKVIVVNSQEHVTTTFDDLTQVINRHTINGNGNGNGDGHPIHL